jgi:hypothetical protein
LKKRRSFLIALVFAAILIFPCSVYAAESVSFGASLNPRLQSRLDSFLSEKYKAPLQNVTIARTDLNGDDINELIIRAACTPQKPALCDFVILADTDPKLTELGVIKAFSLNIADKTHSGVRNIIAYSNVTNQFDAVVYVWDSLASRYTIER